MDCDTEIIEVVAQNPLDLEEGDKSNDNIEYSSIPNVDLDSPWTQELVEASLPEVHRSIPVPKGENASWWKMCLAYAGPGTLVAVGYMDPGNWSTDIAGGSAYGYKLLFIVMLSSLIAMFLQALSAKVGLATGRDLAQCCRDSYPKYVVIFLWIVTEVAIAATDVAEVLGSAVALNLLFGLPLIAGVCITSVDVFVVLLLQGHRFRVVEAMVGALILIITACFAVQLGLSHPNPGDVMLGFLPSNELVSNKGMLYIATGILGATVMPHNLFLHSSIVLTRNMERTEESIRQSIKFATLDSTVSLFFALFVNAAILIVAAATFHKNGYNNVATLQDAYQLLNPILGSKVAAALFGVALLASGQNSTLTGTLTGQIVMEGFMTWKISPTIRRIVTRLLAIVPAIIATAVYGAAGTNNLLILSQVILSFALPFAIFPLVHITSDPRRMGNFVNSRLVTAIAYPVAIFILALNIYLLA